MKKLTILFTLFISATLAFAQENIDYDVINKIKEEGLKNSKMEEIAFYLTDYSGPRLTNSPGLKTASDWAIEKMQEWGMENAKLDPGENLVRAGNSRKAMWP